MNLAIYVASLWTIVTNGPITHETVRFDTKADCEAMVAAHEQSKVVDWETKQKEGIRYSFTTTGGCVEIRKP